MSIRSRKLPLVSAIAGVAAAALLLAGCASAPSSSASASASSGSSSSSSATVANYLPCVAGDIAGFNDHSFNEAALQGVQQGAQKLGVQYKKVQVANANDYAASLNSLVAEKCSLIVAVGFDFVSYVQAAAKAHPNVNWAIVDDNSIKAANVRDVVFQSDQGAFMAGYAAAAYSKTGKVGTWGGQQIPSVTIYMDGFYDGVQYYNKQKGKNVQVLGWDESSQQGIFVGNFTSQTTAQQDTQNMLNQGADVIFPVAGSLYQGAQAAITASHSDAVYIGVDSDIFESDPTHAQNVLVSALKLIAPAVSSVVEQAGTSTSFDNTQIVGTIANNSVGLSSFHNYASKIPSGLQSELDTISKSIADGSIKVNSPQQF